MYGVVVLWIGVWVDFRKSSFVLMGLGQAPDDELVGTKANQLNNSCFRTRDGGR